MKDRQTTAEPSPSSLDFGVIIVGAGISGINTAYYLHTQTPWLSYAILDGRSRIGGTWDFFHYPGIRSDSDMLTFGFSWNPWAREQRLGTAEQIRLYLRESAQKFGIDKNIRCDSKVLSADWSTTSKCWTLSVINGQGATRTYRAKFMVFGTGYYDYNNPLKTAIPGLDNFGGPVVHPQFWPEELDYAGKDVVVIGSGATAVTLIPSVAEKAGSVTMLQRSPSYIISRPMVRQESGLVKFAQRILPLGAGNWFKRIHAIVTGIIFQLYCTAFPEKVRLMLREATMKQLPANLSWDPHFNPRYNLWRQRLCLCPDGDFYAVLRSGKATIVTDTIEAMTSTEIHLTSGKILAPDIIITATGLQLQFGGGIKLSIDGQTIDCNKKYVLRGTMVQDVPNFAFIVGYVRASWTMGAEVTGQFLVRLFRLMKRRGASIAVPRLDGSEGTEEKPVFDLSSTYVQSANRIFPRAGNGHWGYRQNYLVDMLKAQWGDISKGLYIE